MIYDCFSFFNELDVLEIRLNVLKDVVDKFVLVEAPWTHTGKAKPLYFAENKDRYAAFGDKVIHIVVTDNDLPPFPQGATEREIAWIRENVQRNAIAKGLTAAQPDDIIMISDLDEIPDPEKVLLAAKSPLGITNLNLRNYAFFLNNLNVSCPSWEGGPQLLTYKTFLDVEIYKGFNFSEYVPRCANGIPSATIIRFTYKGRTLKKAGWHFTSMGGIDAIVDKLRSFAHTEFVRYIDSPQEIEKIVHSGNGLFSVGEKFMPEPLAGHLPDYVVQNQIRLAKFLLPASEGKWKRLWLRRFQIRMFKIMYDGTVSFLITMAPRRLHPFFRSIRNSLGL